MFTSKDTQRRLATLRHFLENKDVSEESIEDQVEVLLFHGNVLGLGAAVAHVRQRLNLDTVADRYRRAEEAANRALDALVEHYMPRIHALIEYGDIEGATTLSREIPCGSVCHAFAQDALRQATKET